MYSITNTMSPSRRGSHTISHRFCSPRRRRLTPQPTPIPEPLWDIQVIRQPDWLSDIWQTSLIASLTTATPQIPEKIHSSAQARYLNFCLRMQFNPLPANQQQLILFAADLSQTIAYTSMRMYLCSPAPSHF